MGVGDREELGEEDVPHLAIEDAVDGTAQVLGRVVGHDRDDDAATVHALAHVFSTIS